MENMNYKIEFLSDWHVGSGLDSGAEADSLVLKDDDNLPYIPGKTIKGLLKDALREMAELGQADVEAIVALMGKDAENKDKEKVSVPSKKGSAFFTNAELPDKERTEIVSNKLQEHLYRNIASTKINKKGVAEKGSLRTMEVCMPLVLEGEIEYEHLEHKEVLEKAIKWTRHLGVNRNRGLGRCKITCK
ncbi:MAG: RAMP superfamily CRISPR-associated protein [Bacteroidota bacterium]|nr:RAMP superfamily CRISPR-associated protein [Bacteroidota bacterium]